MPRFRTPFNAIEDPPGFDPKIYPQAQVDPVDFDILDQADAGEGVLNGCLVTASSPEALTVDVQVGQIVIDGEIWDVDATADIAIPTPNITQPRADLVCADDSGTPFIVDGLPADASPMFPSGASVMGLSVVLGAIYVEAGLSDITEDHITDKRAHVHLPPVGASDWIPVRATSDLSRSNDASLTADTVLKFTMVANTKYAVRGRVVISTISASNARSGFLGPASPTILQISANQMMRVTGFASTPQVWNLVAYDTVGRVMSSSSNSEAIIEFEAIIHNGSNTSPDFAFAWGQGTAVAQNTIRRAGSYLEYAAF